MSFTRTLLAAVAFFTTCSLGSPTVAQEKTATADGQVAFQSLAELVIGGVWVRTDDDQYEHSYRWGIDEKFICRTAKGGPLPDVATIGIDPESKQLTWWFFNQDGSLGKSISKLEKEGVWSFEQSSEGNTGDNSYKGLVTRVDQNTIKEEVLEWIVNGEKQEIGTLIWKRTQGRDFAREQKEVWDTLETQVALDLKKDFDAEKKHLHPKASYWGDRSPAPVSASAKTYSYYEKWSEGQDEVVAHQMIPVTVVVVDDVAIINFYLHILTNDDEGEQEELIIRGHNTWKKENGHWLLLATYNTVVSSDDDD
ncbi:hypothetical protein NZK35_25275 [Stieleria sp. ICT_E10.1]|uniref:hypothetical protein n=1 Tax=Stieleria sedimenti TaxID=2976331 RepID=UPI00217F3D85|nr:hypothetical protein [Stieleria sedimenti]MCS7469976.1 hypothetical protein [Stieleria sedimenti]